MVGFGRASGDGIYRAVLWDVVVNNDHQGLGIGSKIVDALLNARSMKNAERIYLMTTNCEDFYKVVGFKDVNEQKLMVFKKAEFN